MKLKQTRKIHIRTALVAMDNMTREELNRAKYGLEFSEQPQPRAIVVERKPEPMRFSLANLIPVGV
jgi:hypothetical protein